MNPINAQVTSRVSVALCCLVLLLAVVPARAAMPDAQPSAESAIAAREAAHDELVGRMLTPRAEIRLGPGLADTERLMRRASSPSLSYTIRSLWAGIVEYVFPPHGLFRRGEILARVPFRPGSYI